MPPEAITPMQALKLVAKNQFGLGQFAQQSDGKSAKTILIIEPFVQGHHGTYLHWIIRALLHRGHAVQLATFEPSLSHPSMRELLSNFGGQLTIITKAFRAFGTFDGNFIRMAADMVVFRQLVGHFYTLASRDSRIDFVLLPYLDYCTYALAVAGSPFGSTPWGGITMRTAFHYAAMGVKAPTSNVEQIKKRLFCRLLRDQYLRALFTIDQTLFEYAQVWPADVRSRLVYLPDLATTKRSIGRAAARERLKIAQDALIILVYGSLAKRKGIEALLQASEHSDFPSRCHLLLAGKQDPAARSILQSPLAMRLRHADRLHEITHHLSEEDENIVFSASDAVWLGYLEHYQMSGVLVQAGMMGLPSIACEEGLIGWLTTRHQSGVVVPISDPSSVARQIRDLFETPDRARECGNNGRKAYASHTEDCAARILLEAIGV
jgi:glycosyltransferase involved in cell wall biosynthesis